jgi:Protein of unknown function (DUF2370)
MASDPLASDPLANDAERALADSFDHASGGEESEDEDTSDDRQRLMRSQTAETAVDTSNPREGMQRRMTQLPQFNPSADAGITAAATASRNMNDGVFANLDAKPQAGEKAEEPPVSYIQQSSDGN